MSSEIHKPVDSEVLVRVEGVSKKFCRSLKKSLWYGLCDIGGELSPFGRQARGKRQEAQGGGDGLRDGEFWAVNDVSFELRRGECLGLIGHNGAGKTTLLKMLNGLIKPDAGTITMRGRVGALIALGAGFNPILTGRENIYTNGSVLGLSKKEIDEKIDEIIDFSEIGDFIDTPVQNYSSGMSVRLGFAIASSLSPDVLILDEVLAVGDVGFVIKSLNRVRELTANAAVILVSHQMQFVSQFCSHVILLEHGKVAVEATEPQIAVNQYFTLARSEPTVSGAGGLSMHDVRFSGDAVLASGDKLALQQGRKAILELDFSILEANEPAYLHVTIADQAETSVIICLITANDGEKMRFSQGRHQVTIDLGAVDLNSGRYSLELGAEGADTGRIMYLERAKCPFAVSASHNHWAKIVRSIVPRNITSAVLS